MGKKILVFLLIVAIAGLAGMGGYLYKVNESQSKLEDEKKALESRIANLEKSSTGTQGGISTDEESLNADNDITNTDSSSTTVERKKQNFFGMYESKEKPVQYIFLPNGEMRYSNTESSSNKPSYGTYTVENGKLYYSFSVFEPWFNGVSSAMILDIKDDITLKYNDMYYMKVVVDTLSGTFTSDDEDITFTDGTFTSSAYSNNGETLEGTYTIKDNVAKLEYKDKKMKDRTLLLLDQDVIIEEFVERGIYQYKLMKK